MAPFQGGFEPGEKKVTGTEIRGIEGWGNTGMIFSVTNSLMESAVWHGALSWCSIQVRAMPGRTCATVFPSLSRTSWLRVWLTVCPGAQIPCWRSLDCQKNKWALIWFWICSFSLSWDGESLQCATPKFGVLSRGRTPKSMIHHLW